MLTLAALRERRARLLADLDLAIATRHTIEGALQQVDWDIAQLEKRPKRVRPKLVRTAPAGDTDAR